MALPQEPKGKSVPRDEVVAALRRAMVEQGYAKVNLRDVAAGLGISKGMIYYHVGSKEQVLYETVMQRYRRLGEHFEGIMGYPIPARDRLRIYLRERTRDDTTPDARLDDEARYMIPAHWQEYITVRDAHQERLVRLLEDGIAAGELRGLPDAKIAAFAILGMMAEFHHWYRDGGRLSRDEVADLWWELICNGILPPGGPAAQLSS